MLERCVSNKSCRFFVCDRVVFSRCSVQTARVDQFVAEALSSSAHPYHPRASHRIIHSFPSDSGRAGRHRCHYAKLARYCTTLLLLDSGRRRHCEVGTCQEAITRSAASRCIWWHVTKEVLLRLRLPSPFCAGGREALCGFVLRDFRGVRDRADLASSGCGRAGAHLYQKLSRRY